MNKDKIQDFKNRANKAEQLLVDVFKTIDDMGFSIQVSMMDGDIIDVNNLIHGIYGLTLHNKIYDKNGPNSHRINSDFYD